MKEEQGGSLTNEACYFSTTAGIIDRTIRSNWFVIYSLSEI